VWGHDADGVPAAGGENVAGGGGDNLRDYGDKSQAAAG